VCDRERESVRGVCDRVSESESVCVIERECVRGVCERVR